MLDPRIPPNKPFDVNTIPDEPPIPPRVAKLAKDLGVNLVERALTHGDFTDQAAISQALKYLMENTDGWSRLTPVQAEALHMIVHKIARILAGDPNFADHWDDIAGYAKITSDRTVR